MHLNFSFMGHSTMRGNTISKFTHISTTFYRTRNGRFFITFILDMPFDGRQHFVSSITFQATVLPIINSYITFKITRLSTAVIFPMTTHGTFSCETFTAFPTNVSFWKNTLLMFVYFRFNIWRNSSHKKLVLILRRKL